MTARTKPRERSVPLPGSAGRARRRDECARRADRALQRAPFARTALPDSVVAESVTEYEREAQDAVMHVRVT